MNQRATASTAFVPFDPVPSTAAKPPGASTGLKVMPKAEAVAGFAPLHTPASTSAHSHAGGGNAGVPVVTLQREGERVTGIRVECTCGQIIELACSY